MKINKINFPGASTQTPQGRLPPASQERGIRPNLAALGISLHDASIGECTLLWFKPEYKALAQSFTYGNIISDHFLQSSDALDLNQGITYVLLSDKKNAIIGYYNIEVVRRYFSNNLLFMRLFYKLEVI